MHLLDKQGFTGRVALTARQRQLDHGKPEAKSQNDLSLALTPSHRTHSTDGSPSWSLFGNSRVSVSP